MAKRKEIKQPYKPTWMIHAIRNGVPCTDCGKVHYPFLPGMADYHTDGLKAYGQMELQLVLDFEPQTAAMVLNTLGLQVVEHGRRFCDGDSCDDIFPSTVKFQAIKDEDGITMLRVIVADPNGRFPSDADCQEYFCAQDKPLSMLRNSKEMTH